MKRTLWLTALCSACVVGGGEKTHRFANLHGVFIERGSGDVTVWGEADRTAAHRVTACVAAGDVTVEGR